MSCCEHKYYERMKSLQHVIMLACQVANVTEITQGVYVAKHGVYGRYYRFDDYVKLKENGTKILRKLKAGDTL